MGAAISAAGAGQTKIAAEMRAPAARCKWFRGSTRMGHLPHSKGRSTLSQGIGHENFGEGMVSDAPSASRGKSRSPPPPLRRGGKQRHGEGLLSLRGGWKFVSLEDHQ